MTWLLLIAFAALAILIAGTPIALWQEWQSKWNDRKFRRELACRESLSDVDFIAEFYHRSTIPPDIPLGLRPIYGEFFGIDPSKIHPADLPPDIYEFDTKPLVDAIETEFGITIDADEQDRTTGAFDSIVKCIHRITCR